MHKSLIYKSSISVKNILCFNELQWVVYKMLVYYTIYRGYTSNFIYL